MSDEPTPPLAELLNKIKVLLQEPLDFRQADTATTLRKVQLLAAVAAYFNVLAVSDFGGRMGAVREEGLVEQAIGSAFQTFSGYDPHPDAFEKAAMLLRGITQGHPFYDGNKRTGFLLAAYYLDAMRHPMPASLPVDETVDLCVRVSAGLVRDIYVIANELRALWKPAAPEGS